VKKINYYAQPNPWKMPKWVGITMGGIFGTVAVGAAVLIVQLTKPAHAEAIPVANTAVIAAPAAPEAVVTAPPVQPEPAKAARSSAPSKAKIAKLNKKKAARSLAEARAKKSSILARHDSRDKRKQKDDLDRLLGL
jgi:predicted lipid-binding transport protein (Tim44 family)